MMWILIMLITLAATIGIFVYLISRFGKFTWVRKLSHDRKGIRRLISFFVVLDIGAFCYCFMDFINAAVVLLHLGIFWLICDLTVFIIGLIRKKKIRNEKIYYAGIAAVTMTVVYLSCGWYLAHHVWEKHYTIETEKEVGDFRIVQFADSHIGTTFHGKGFAENMKRIQETNPDVIVITGDFVDDDTTREDMIDCCTSLGTLKAKYGIYYSFGNHDKGYYGDEHRGYSGKDLISELEKNGVHVLQDETDLLQNEFYIIGRQDRSEEQRGFSRASMQELMKDLDSDKFSVVLDHQPHDYKNQEAVKADLVLSGHTHGGQMFPITYVGEWIGENDKTYGWEKRTDTNFIVTSGISDWALKFKTGCRSEFVVIDIKGTR